MDNTKEIPFERWRTLNPTDFKTNTAYYFECWSISVADINALKQALQEKDTIIQQLRDEVERLKDQLDPEEIPQQEPLPFGYSKEQIESFDPLEKAAYEMIQTYNPRGTAVIGNSEWPTYDQYTVLEMLCNFREEVQLKSAEPQQPTNEAGQGASNLKEI